MAECMAGLGAVAAAIQQSERAARLLAAADSLLKAIDQVIDPSDRVEFDHAVSTARMRMGEQAFDAAWAEGRGLTTEQAIGLALGDS